MQGNTIIRPVTPQDLPALCAIYNHYVANTVISFEEAPVTETDFAARIAKVQSGIALPNPGSVALHEKFGMTQASLYREVGFKFGKWIDVGYWQGVLRSGS